VASPVLDVSCAARTADLLVGWDRFPTARLYADGTGASGERHGYRLVFLAGRAGSRARSPSATAERPRSAPGRCAGRSPTARPATRWARCWPSAA
jgi:hypothetical protein